MLINAEQLKREAAPFGIELDAVAIERFDSYAKLLVEWNKKINLTAITEPEAIVTRHFADSLSFFSAAKPQDKASLIDIGSGAGFPGMPIKIVRPDMQVTLLDGTNKRITFLSEVARELGLQVNAIHSRAEEAAVKAELREKFDLATARAVAELRLLGEYCLGFVKVGGALIAMKGKLTEQEVADAQHCLSVMGGKIDGSRTLLLADSSERTLLTVKKSSQTPTEYPRCSAKIAKKPL